MPRVMSMLVRCAEAERRTRPEAPNVQSGLPRGRSRAIRADRERNLVHLQPSSSHGHAEARDDLRAVFRSLCGREW